MTLTIDRNYKDNRAHIRLDIPMDLLPGYLSEFRRMFGNRAFLAEKQHLFQVLRTREKEILALIIHNYSNQEIADKLYMTLDTTKTHRKNIIRKLGYWHPAELMMYRVFG